MMARLALLLTVAAACSYPALPAVAQVDGPPPDAQLCFGSYVTVCFDTVADVPNAAKMFAANTDIDTDSTDAAMCNQAHDQKTRYCVIAGAGITITAGTTLRARGSKPLVLISTMAVNLEGNVDASSTGSTIATQGAGANPRGSCTAVPAALGGSAGPGGSFAGVGGVGATIGSNPAPAPAPAVGFPIELRGGCPGGTGTQVQMPGGVGGSGGGALAILAPSVTLNGTLNASGAGGAGGGGGGGFHVVSGGGGGGGSGGMILLETAAGGIVHGPTGLLIANGGGGGGGGGVLSAQGGSASTQPIPGASGGSGGAGGNEAGGTGGTGSAGSTGLNGGISPTTSVPQGLGGGGGGGGAGFIHAPGIVGDAIISPPSQNLPQQPG